MGPGSVAYCISCLRRSAGEDDLDRCIAIVLLGKRWIARCIPGTTLDLFTVSGSIIDIVGSRTVACVDIVVVLLIRSAGVDLLAHTSGILLLSLRAVNRGHDWSGMSRRSEHSPRAYAFPVGHLATCARLAACAVFLTILTLAAGLMIEVSLRTHMSVGL